MKELTDCHWEVDGFLDMKRKPRDFLGAFTTIISGTEILPSWNRLSHRCGIRHHGTSGLALGVERASEYEAKPAKFPRRFSHDQREFGDHPRLESAVLLVRGNGHDRAGRRPWLGCGA